MLALGTPADAGVSPFAGVWHGHTRVLWITPGGLGRESIGDGCCHPVVNLHFQLRGATATATWVQVRDPKAFTKRRPAPHVGQKATLRVRAGVLYEPLTRTTYCANGVEKCGA